MTYETILLGDIPAIPDFVCLIVAYMLGGFIFKYAKAKKAAASNTSFKSDKPIGFSWAFFVKAKENITEFFVALICGWALVRFATPKTEIGALLGIVFGYGLLGQAFVLDLIFEFFRAGDALKTYRIKKGQ